MITIALTIGLAVFIPFAYPLVSQILLLILFAAYVVGSILLYQEYSTLRKGIDMSQDLLSGLLAYVQRVKDVLKYEELISLVMYPISACAGFFFGMKLFDPEAVIMDSQREWVSLVATLIVLTPLAHIITRLANKRSFGKQIKHLEQHISELRKES